MMRYVVVFLLFVVGLWLMGRYGVLCDSWGDEFGIVLIVASIVLAVFGGEGFLFVRVIGLIVLSVVVPVINAERVLSGKFESLEKMGLESQGVVVSVKGAFVPATKYYHGGPVSGQQEVKYKYVVDGAVYYGCDYAQEKMAVDDGVHVLYMPDRPEVSMLGVKNVQ